MTLPEIIDVTRQKLRQLGHVSNEYILEQCSTEDASYWLRLVRDTIIFEGIAKDENQLGLQFVSNDQRLPEREYDVFISYARQDNAVGRIDDIYQQMCRRFLENSGRSLRIFYDRNEIKGADDWSRRLGDGLRQSKIMVAVLSPNYFTSQWCQKEWIEFYQQEIGLGLFEEGIAPVYIIRMPEFFEIDEQQLDDWKRDLRKRQLLNFVDWYENGEKALIREEIQHRFQQLDEICFKRLEQIDRIRKSHHNLPRHFRHFFGREEDIRVIQQNFNREQPPVVGLWGMAGIGKSTLAFEYGLAYADRYAGGRFQIPAANIVNILSGLKDLMIREFDWTFTEEENNDDSLAYSRIRRHFITFFRQNSNYCTLLIFDNVENPHSIFSSNNIQKWIPEGTHIILTTRQRIDTDTYGLIVSYPVTELSSGASIQLLGSYRPYVTEHDRSTAEAIIYRLGRFTLALNIAGIFLEKDKNRTYSYQRLLHDLEEDDIQLLDQIGELDDIELYNYSAKVVSKLFYPLLATLSPEQRRAVEYASVLPSDTVVLPWLESQIGTDFPEIFTNNLGKKQLISPWERIVRQLKRLGIWLDTNNPEVVSMHRILQSVINSQFEDKNWESRHRWYTLIENRSNELTESWYRKDNYWEVRSLINFINSLINIKTFHEQKIFRKEPTKGEKALNNLIRSVNITKGKIDTVIESKLYHNMAMLHRSLGYYKDAAQWAQKSIVLASKNFEHNHYSLSGLYHSMALIQYDLGEFEKAEKWIDACVEIAENSYGQSHVIMSTFYSTLAEIEQHLGYFTVAESFMKASIAIGEMHYEPMHPTFATLYSIMATVQHDLKRFTEAKEWILKSIAIGEMHYEPMHPTFTTLYSIMATVQRDLKRFTEAEEWILKSIAIGEMHYEPMHPTLATLYSIMATVQRDLKRFTEAEEWILKSIAIYGKNYGSTHIMLGGAYLTMATIIININKQEMAYRLYEQAYWIHKTQLGEIHPQTEHVVEHIEMDYPYYIKIIKRLRGHMFTIQYPEFKIRYVSSSIIKTQSIDNWVFTFL